MRATLTEAAASGRWRITGARLPAVLVTAADLPAAGAGLVAADLVIAGGRVEAITAPGTSDVAPRADLDGGMLWPGLVDCHTHLDKAQIWPRAANPDGSFTGASLATAGDRTRRWTADDIRRRMDFALRAAYAHGTVAIRTHLDAEPVRLAHSFAAFRTVRAAWQGRMTLQAACLVGTEDIDDDGLVARVLAELKATPGAVLGAFVRALPEDRAELPRRLQGFFRLAAAHDLPLDFHVDETTDPRSRGLHLVAEAALATGFRGKVLCGHCCAVSGYADDAQRRTLERAARAGIGVVALPLCNEYLQDRAPGRTPRLRATAPVHELRAAGVAVALGSDNTRDPWHAYGDLDLIELFRQAMRMLHLDQPVDPWPAAVARDAAALMGVEAGLISPGRPADLIALTARGWSELGARPQSDRVVIRNGVPIPDTPPDFRELDDLEGFADAGDF